MKKILPRALHRWLQKKAPVKAVDFGDLRRLEPISRQFGYDRGGSINRYYIEKFLNANRQDIRERVLEIGDDRYILKFGEGRVLRSDVLHAVAGNSQATLVGDLSNAGFIEENSFDCIILVQTLQCIYNLERTIFQLERILRPGGVVLATLSGISQISRYDMDRWGEYWRFTTLSARKLFEEYFAPNSIQVEAYGNVLVALAYLHGLGLSDLKPAELDYLDSDYQAFITVRAQKAS